MVEPSLLSPSHGEWVLPVSTEYEGAHHTQGGVLVDAARRQKVDDLAVTVSPDAIVEQYPTVLRGSAYHIVIDAIRARGREKERGRERKRERRGETERKGEREREREIERDRNRER